jgi:hypothetical protein
MPSPVYTPLPWKGTRLTDQFQLLLQAGHKPDAALILLTALCQGRVGPVEITPPLPPGWLFIRQDRSVAVQAGDKVLDAAQFFLKHPPAYRPPFVVSTAAAAEAKDDVAYTGARTKDRPLEQESGGRSEELAAAPPVPSSATPSPAAPDAADEEERAIALAAALLKPDDSVKRGDLLATLKDQPQFSSMSEKYFLAHVWPQARKRAGLPRVGKPGPKKKLPKSPT